jgi:hypothetical protein
MSRLGSHLALSAQPRRRFFDKTGGGRYLGLFALGNMEPGAGKRGFDFCSVHHASPYYLASVSPGTVPPLREKENP